MRLYTDIASTFKESSFLRKFCRSQRRKKEIKFSRKNQGNFLIFREFYGNALYKEFYGNSLCLQAKFSFMFDILRIFQQLTLVDSLNKRAPWGGQNWLAVVMVVYLSCRNYMT